MKKYDELITRLRSRKITYGELKELRKLLEDRIRLCEEKEECDEALNEHIILRMVDKLIERLERRI